MTQIQRERKEKIREYCTSHGIKQTLQDINPTDMIVDEKNKIVYCVIYKVSSKWLKNMMWTISEGQWKGMSKYTKEEGERILETYFKFMFVRQPLERLLSAFINKLYYVRDPMYRKIWGKKILKLYRPNATQEAIDNGDDIAFDEFAQFVLRDQYRDPHWADYQRRCHPCAIDYDFIGHFENLQDELPHLYEAAGIEDAPQVKKEYITANTTSKVRSYYSQLPKSRIQRLAEMYRPDYEMFRYPFPGPLFEELLEELDY